MIERISHIPNLKSSLDKLPKSPNRIVNYVRAMIILAVLSPGSCVGVGAAGSWAYGKVNNVSVAENEGDILPANPDGAKNDDDDIVKWIKKYLSSAKQNNVDPKANLSSVTKE